MNRGIRLVAILFVLMGGSITPALAADHYVCSAGVKCGPSGTSYADLQDAIDAAANGDTIYLASGETFTGNFTLPVVSGATTYDGVTITTLFSGAPMLPEAGDRICPTGSQADLEDLCTPNIDPDILARVQPTQGNLTILGIPAFRCDAGAIGWSIKLVRLTNSYRGGTGGGTPISCGDNDTSDQGTRAQQPSYFTVDQNYFDFLTFHPYWGQRRAVELHGKFFKFTNNYIEGVDQFQFPSGGTDGQAIWVCNGEGPYDISNNWVRGGTEIFLTCGSKPGIFAVATWSGTPTSTGGTLVWSAGATPSADCPFVGQVLAVSINGATERAHRAVATVSCGSATADVTYAEITDTIDAPGDIRWGMNPGDCSIKGTCTAAEAFRVESNVFSRSLADRAAAIIPTPTTFAATGNTGGGSLTAGDWTVWVSARAAAQGDTIFSAAAGPLLRTVGASGTISWSVDAMHADVTAYRVYYTLDGVTTYYTDFATNSGTVTAATTTSTIVTSGSGRRYKTLFEMKAGINIRFRFNYLFNSWSHSGGDGTMGWFKNVNQAASNDVPSVSGNHPFIENRDGLVEYNVFRAGPRLFKVAGIEYENNNDYYRPVGTSGLIFRNNLAFDISTTTYGGSGSQLLIGDGCSACTFDHNTLDPATGIMLEPNSSVSRNKMLSDGFVVQNNLLVRNTTGIKGAGISEGIPSIAGVEGTNGGAYTINRNVWGNRTSGPSLTCCEYPEHNVASPVGNVFVAIASWQALFADYASATILGYKLAAMSAYATAASDGTAIGVTDIDLLDAEMAKTLSGLQDEDEDDPDPPSDPGGIGPTRFYLTRTSFTDFTVAYASEWNKTSSAVRYALAEGQPTTSTFAEAQASVSTATTPEFHLLGQFISEPLVAQVISGTLRCQVRARQNNTSLNGTLAIGARIVSGDGTTVRGVLLAPSASDDTSTTPPEFHAASAGGTRNRACRDSTEATDITLSSVTAQAGDLLVIEVGYRDADTGTSRSGTALFGDASANDLGDGDTNTSEDDNPFVEIGDGIVFVGVPEPDLEAGSRFRFVGQ